MLGFGIVDNPALGVVADAAGPTDPPASGDSASADGTPTAATATPTPDDDGLL